MPPHVVAVDLGGTKILTAVVSEQGKIAAQHRADTPQTGVDAVVDAIANTVRAALRDADIPDGKVVGVGIGAPGPLNPESGIVFDAPNLAGWRDVPLKAKLEARLLMPVYVEHDATAAALGEWWLGAGRGVHDMIYLTIGTGIGGGIIIGDRLVHGVSGTAGEVGHMTIDVNGPPCPCGRSTGCLEVLAAGPAIARMAREAIAAGRRTAILTRAGGRPDEVSAGHVEAAAREGDRVAIEIFTRAATYIGIGVANLLNLLNPARVIIGGGVSKAGDLLFDTVRRVARQRAFERPGQDASIVPAELGDDAGPVGVAAVAFQRTGIKLR